MRLRSKIVVILSAVIALYASATLAIQRFVILPGFVRLEQDEAERDASRAREAIAREIYHLDKFCQDWGAWDDTYEFVVEPNDEYIAGNLYADYFRTGHFTLVYYFDIDGHLTWGENRDPGNDFELAPVEALPARDWPLDHPLLANRDLDRGTSGVLRTERGPFLVASRPIITSEQTGPQRGWLVMGKLLSDEQVASLVEQTRVDFRLAPLDSAELSAGEQQAVASLASGEQLVIHPLDERWLEVHAQIDDIRGAPALLLTAKIEREVTARGASVLDFALASTLAVAALLLVVLVVILQRSVVSPLSRLTDHAVAIAQSDDLSARLDSDRNDEIGVLSREFDRMVEQLAESRSQLVDAAHKGGMSEVATSVLHNVGNVLNSVNVSSAVVSEKLDSQNLRDLERAVDVMSQHQADLGRFIDSDPRGKHLPEFLRSVVRSLCEERAALTSEARTLSTGIGHIRALIDAQQGLAHQSGVAERISLERQVEAALGMAMAGVEVPGLELERDFGELPPLCLQKHKLLQILVNLIRNALQSVQAAEGGERRVTLRIARAGALARVEVRDTGTGIAREHLERIFNHGFTTKPGGHGFGLHSCANAAHELGGRLSATSDGPGRGACFTLELPLESTAPSKAL